MSNKVNNFLMREIGLEIDSDHRIIDQDTGNVISFKGSILTEQGYRGSNTMEFDPYNNKKQMNALFGYFLNKVSDESDVAVTAFYNINDKDNKGHVECVMSDNSKIESKSYIRDSLKYADIISQLNGGEHPDLDDYDVPFKKETVKKGVRKNGKSNPKTAKNS